MADIDINPFEEHELRPEEPNDEHIPFTPVGPEGALLGDGGGLTWDPRGSQALRAHWNQHMNRKHNLEV